MLRYFSVRLLHELMEMPCESEINTYFTRSQIAIVKEAETLILQDLSRRITAKEMADRFGISESSFKLYVKGILGESYLTYFRKKRMEKAAEFLESTNLKVIEVANSVGYENQGLNNGRTYEKSSLPFSLNNCFSAFLAVIDFQHIRRTLYLRPVCCLL